MAELTEQQIWTETAAERREFANFLDTLRDEQWNVDSLCEGWRVRDVVAHSVQACTDTIRRVMWGIAKTGGRPMVYFEHSARKTGDKLSPKQLTASLRAVIDSQRTLPQITPAMMLADVLIHQQDVRRPLGLARTIPATRLLCSLSTEVDNKFVSGDGGHLAGLKLRATDIDWTYGDGPEVAGSGEALLMVIARRPAATADLTGSGVATLVERLS